MGEMNKPLFDIDRAGLQVEVNSYTPGKGLAWPVLFPLKYTRKFDIKGLEGDEGIPVSADRVAFNTKAPLKTRKMVGAWNGVLAKISIAKQKDELQVNEYQEAQVLAASNDDPVAAKELVNLVYDDVKGCSDGMDYRVEMDALRIGSSGRLALNSKYDGDMAESDELNFNVPAKHYLGSTAPWSDHENADGLGDIIAGMKLIAKEGGNKPRYAILEQAAYEELCMQKKTINRVAGVILKAVGLASVDNVDLDTINRYMQKNKYPQLLVIDSYVTIEQKNGSRETVKPWNENVVTLSPEARLGYTYYKPVPIQDGTEAIQTQGSYFKVTRYSEVNPLAEVTMAEAYVQPALSNRKSLVFLNVASTKWNGGEADKTA
jgi:hypothetical protein